MPRQPSPLGARGWRGLSLSGRVAGSGRFGFRWCRAPVSYTHLDVYKRQASDFVRRNRIIAGMSRALIVVEAEFKSGTSSTVDAALKYGREVLAVPLSLIHI